MVCRKSAHAWLWLLCLCLAWLSLDAGSTAQARLARLFAVTEADLPGKPDAYPLSAFDLSPDGNTMAVVFFAAGQNLRSGSRAWTIEVAKWEVRTGRFIAQGLVDGPALNSDLRPSPEYRDDIRFTPTGARLVVQAGRRLHVLNTATLERSYSIAAPVLNSIPSVETVIRGFSISGDGQWLAVLSSPATTSCQPTNIRLFRLDSGMQAADWVVPQACAFSVSLSFDGSRVLLANFKSAWPAEADVLLLESLTGKILRMIDAGYAGHGNGFGVKDAVFAGRDRFLTIPNRSVVSRADLAAHTLKVWDMQNGQLVQELRYGMSGIIADDVAVAMQTGTLATITMTNDIAQIGRTDSVKSVPQLLLFHIGDREPFFVSQNLTFASLITSRNLYTSPVRLSLTGETLAFKQGKAVEVYDVLGTARPAGRQQ